MEEYREEQTLGRRSERNRKSKGKRVKPKKEGLTVDQNNEIDEIERRINEEKQRREEEKYVAKTAKKQKNKVKKKSSKKNKFLVLLILINIIALLGLVFARNVHLNGGGLSGALAAVMGHNNKTLENLETFDILIIGVSNGIDAKLSDTIMVGSYDPKLQKASLMSIPRDTFTGTYKSSATPNDKINAIYSLTEDPDKVLAAVNDILGLNIENYLVIETEVLVEIVDEVGGIEFYVPIDMKYDDNKQNLHIDLTEGLQVLTGRQAEWLVRFRKNNNGTTYPSSYGSDDTGRMRTQREFIMAAIEQIAIPSNITKIGTFLDIVVKNVITNVNFNDAKDYIPYIVNIDTQNILTGTLPGVNELCNGTWVFLPDYTEIPQVVDTMFNFKDTALLTEQIESVEIQIVDATGTTDGAEEAKEKLEEAGYNVSIVSTLEATSTTTIVKQETISYELAENIKTVIEKSSALVTDDQAAASGNDENVVQIILGK